MRRCKERARLDCLRRTLSHTLSRANHRFHGTSRIKNRCCEYKSQRRTRRQKPQVAVAPRRTPLGPFPSVPVQMSCSALSAERMSYLRERAGTMMDGLGGL